MIWKHYTFNTKTTQIPAHLEFKVTICKAYGAFYYCVFQDDCSSVFEIDVEAVVFMSAESPAFFMEKLQICYV